MYVCISIIHVTLIVCSALFVFGSKCLQESMTLLLLSIIFAYIYEIVIRTWTVKYTVFPHIVSEETILF